MGQTLSTGAEIAANPVGYATGQAMGGGTLGQMISNPGGTLAGAGVSQLTGGGGLGDLFGKIDGSDALSKALGAEQAGVLQSNQIQQGMYNNTAGMLKPWQQAGAGGLSQLQAAMPGLTKQFNPSDLQNTPGYQFTLNQGLNAMQNSAAARGVLNSGGTMASLNNYAQQAAGTQYQNALGNYMAQNQQTYGMLSGLANYGQTANAQMTNTNNTTGTNMANNVMSGANASAAASMAQGQILPGMIGQGLGFAGLAMGKGG